ncbi:MAG: PqqD family protein, partial [Myxococcales bacterium]|nr:PqqD family protein [Myxococcales bacterium]
RTWQLIQQTNDLQAIYQTLLTEYDVAEDRLQQDLGNLLGEISGLGLIILEQRA